VQAILDREGVTPIDFYVRAVPELSSEGGIRKGSLKTEIYSAVQDRNGEDADRTVTFEFSLPSSSYATTVLREFMKADPSAY